MKQLKLNELVEPDSKGSANGDQYLTELCTRVYNELIRNKNLQHKKPKPTRASKRVQNYSYNISAEFYPYTNIKLTVRQREDRLLIRMSDILSNAPDDILTSAATCIFSRFLRIECDSETRKMYRNYIYSNNIQSKVRNVRQRRAKKRVRGSRGKYFDLEDCFKKINLNYFNGTLSPPTLTWSVSQSRFRVGHYDSDLDTVVISRKLDRKNTPSYVVEYILYHELLHRRCPERFSDGRRRIHTAEFKRAEKLFIEYERAKQWLKNNK